MQDWVVGLNEFDALDLPPEIARKVLRDNAVRPLELGYDQFNSRHELPHKKNLCPLLKHRWYGPY